MDLLTELKNTLAGDVYEDQGTLTKYSTDASLFEVMPRFVVAPKNADDVKQLVKFASKNEISITARSGGTGMDGGSLTESVVVDLQKHLNRFKGIGEGYAVVEPGAWYRDFEKETLKTGQLMPSFPASREICTVGGMVANNSGGELTLRYGKVEDYINELKVVFSDGNEYTIKPLTKKELDNKISHGDFEGDIYKKLFELIESNYEKIQAAKPNVHKNSAGYYLWNVWDRKSNVFDLSKLLVGSQGTLGLVTEINFKLIRREPESIMMIVFLDSFDRLGELVQAVLDDRPTTFECYDDKTLKLALRFGVEFIKRLGLKNILKLAFNGLGEFFSIVRNGLPKLVLQITFEGADSSELERRAEGLQQRLSTFKPRYTEIISSKLEADEYWLVRRESFNLLRHKVKGKKTAPFVDDVSVRPEVLPEFLPKLNKIFESYENKLVYNIAGHIGDGNFHIIPLMDLSDPGARAIIPEIAQKVYDLVFEYGGSTTGEHNDGIIRTPFLRQMYGEGVYGLFEKVKEIFDPKGIFNPGKKVGGTLDYAISKIKTHN